MTSRERVYAALEGKPADRTASSFRAEVEVFQKLQKSMGIKDIDGVLSWAKSDFRDLSFLCNDGGYGGYSSFGWKDKKTGDGSYEDIWGVRRKLVDYGEGSYLDIVFSPLKQAGGIDNIRKYKFPEARKIYDFSPLGKVVDRINTDDEYFVLIEGESLFDRCWSLRGIQQFMVDLVTDEDAALHIINGNYNFFYEYTKSILESAEGKVDAIGMYDDLGNQRGMMISPALYRKYFKELQKKYIRMVNGFGVKVFYHSCGGITDILEDLIDIGIDILDPLQLNAMNLTPEQLVALCGNRVTFHGGINIQDLMVNASPRQVKEEIKKIKNSLGKYNKYILSCSHLLQMDVPLENIRALVEQA
jgi:uroporphyrinogen decarboxylase